MAHGDDTGAESGGGGSSSGKEGLVRGGSSTGSTVELGTPVRERCGLGSAWLGTRRKTCGEVNGVDCVGVEERWPNVLVARQRRNREIPRCGAASEGWCGLLLNSGEIEGSSLAIWL
jgi:hypothetical protein